MSPKSIFSQARKSFQVGLYDRKISALLSIVKASFFLTLFMNVLSLLALIFSGTKYYYKFLTPQFLDVILVLISYGTFYVLIFVAFPACILLLIIYLLYKLERTKNIEIKSYLRLIFFNLFILAAIITMITFRFM